MKVVDKFLNVLNLNDNVGFEDDYLDDGYGEEYEAETSPKRRVIAQTEEPDDYDIPEEVRSLNNRDSYEGKEDYSSRKEKIPSRIPRSSAKVSPIRAKRSSGDVAMEVCVIRPHSMEDVGEILDTLNNKCTIVLNMEGLDLDIAQRIIDISAGACYAFRGGMQRISNYIFILTPEKVDISGDIQEMLSGSFDVPSFGASF